MATLEVDQLTKQFGPVVAVDQVTFRVEQGTVVGFLGPNGAGQDHHPAHAARPGRPHPRHRHHQRPAVPRSARTPPRRRRRPRSIQPLPGTHREQTTCASRPSPPTCPRSRVDEVLDLVDLTEAADRRVGQYSLGMRQRLGLATALLCDPEILILDEPANGLDPEGVHWLRRLLRHLAGEGRTVLVSSHILAEVAQTVDSVVIMDHGRLVTHTSLGELTDRATKVIRIRTPRPEQLAALLVDNGATAHVVGPDRLEVTGASGELIGTLAAEAAIPIFETTTEAADLEDVFLQLTASPATPAPPTRR